MKTREQTIKSNAEFRKAVERAKKSYQDKGTSRTVNIGKNLFSGKHGEN